MKEVWNINRWIYRWYSTLINIGPGCSRICCTMALRFPSKSHAIRLGSNQTWDHILENPSVLARTAAVQTDCLHTWIRNPMLLFSTCQKKKSNAVVVISPLTCHFRIDLHKRILNVRLLVISKWLSWSLITKMARMDYTKRREKYKYEPKPSWLCQLIALLSSHYILYGNNTWPLTQSSTLAIEAMSTCGQNVLIQ